MLLPRVDEEELAPTTMSLVVSPPPSPTPPAASDLRDSIESGGRAMETSGEEHAPLAVAISSGLCGDPARCIDLSLEEKRRMVHRISLCPEDALDLLQSWTRRELLQLICAEMGEERKYTGLTKSKMIERLLKLVSMKGPGSNRFATAAPLEKGAGGRRKRRKLGPQGQKPAAVPVQTTFGDGDGDGEKSEAHLCRNLACQAVLDPEDAFCKRCSCCICYRFDENKDPSLWLMCASDDSPGQVASGSSCGLSCHIRCAFREERCGIARAGGLDGGFFCAFCHKENGLIGILRKQLTTAKDARRVDLLCKRVSLSHQILRGTEKYARIQAIVESAAKTLKKEVGPLDKVSARMARGIVNRLACGAEVQKLCALAIEAVDRALSGAPEPPPAAHGDPQAGSPLSAIGFEDVSPTSVVISVAEEEDGGEETVGYRLWHRRSSEAEYADDPTCVLLRPERRIVISGLVPATEYSFRVAPFGGAGGTGRWEEATLVTRPPVASNGNGLSSSCGGGEPAAAAHTSSQRGSTSSGGSAPEGKKKTKKYQKRRKARKSSPQISGEDMGADMGDDSVKNAASRPNGDAPGFAGSGQRLLLLPPVTGSKCKTTPKALPPATGDRSEPAERGYEYCVKVIRWLECEGHMEKEFRVKFLTWFSLKASAQERRVVSAFIDVLIDEPASLVDQLVDAFKDGICRADDKPNGVCNGNLPPAKDRLCTRLWH